MTHTETVVSIPNLILVRKSRNGVLFQAANLPTIHDCTYGRWKWRPLTGFKKYLEHRTGRGDHDLGSFKPTLLNPHWKSDHFTWLDYRLGTGGRAVLHMDDIRRCNFERRSDEETLVPKGWCDDVCHLAVNGILGFDEAGRVIMTDGERGRYVHSSLT